MEQKKILWIVVAVSVFVLIIFGAALILYAPSRSTGPVLQQAANLTEPTRTESKIDPDSWVKDPNTAPGIDSALQPPQGNINLTIVNGDNTGANYGTLDVSALTTAGTPVANPNTPASTQPTDESPLPPIPGQATPNTTVQSTNQTSTTKAVTQNYSVSTEKSTTVVKKSTNAQPAAVAKSNPVKTATQKKITVVEFWIQTGSFSSKLNAEKARESLTARYLKAEIFTKDVAGSTSYRVRVGPYTSKKEADYWLGTVKEIPEFSGSYVSEVKTKK